MPKLGLIFSTVVLLASGIIRAGESAAPNSAAVLNEPYLENAHRLTANLIVGAVPHDERAFAALKRLGVTTLISVDGAAPDVKLAARYDMRYVHLPIGYDEVPEDRSREIGKALTEFPGPIYMHCHHGKHRAPAAAAAACVTANLMSSDDALGMMKKMGTGENYLGLWKSARGAKAAAPGELKALKVNFRSTSPIPPLVEAMVNIDKVFEHLGECQQSGWKAPANHPDLDPKHEAKRLAELYAEMARTDDHKRRPENYQKWVTNSTENSLKLERRLRELSAGTEGVSPQDLNMIFTELQNDCKACHKLYQNALRK